MKLIALTSSTTENRLFLNRAYHDAFIRDGCLPVALPQFAIPNREVLTVDEYRDLHAPALAEYAARMDALCVTGGPDVNSVVVMEEANWAASNCDSERDMMEIGLIRAFMAAGKPILGICKGFQLTNLVLGLDHFQQDLGMTKELHQAAEREFKDRQEPVHSAWVFGAYREYLRGKTGRANLSSVNLSSHHHQGFTLSQDGKIPAKVKTTEQYQAWYGRCLQEYQQRHDIAILAATSMVIESVEKESVKYVGHQAHPETNGPTSLAIGYWIERYLNP
jgi:gamma-glutamyl-gamma-aminobutyrate hydrolase PuuD